MVTTNYKCAQSELYAVARIGWESYTEHLAAFTAFRPMYTLTFVQDALNVLNHAEELPNAQARYAQSEVLKIQLTALAQNNLNQWQFLKRYIETAFPPLEVKPRLEEAGYTIYDKAKNLNWERLIDMNQQAINFLQTHIATLTANDNMPATFQTAYANLATQVKDKHLQFKSAEESAYDQTETKIEANNQVYNQLMSMFKDGQLIFEYDEGIRRQFTFATILELVSSAGPAGVKGTITDINTQLPVENVLVKLLLTDHTVYTDTQGKYEIKPIPSGTYNISVQADNYQPLIIENHKVITGTVSTLNIEIAPQ